MLALFEELTTGLATGLRHAFATEAGGLTPRLCIVRDLTLCSAVKSTYGVGDRVNTAEVDARGGWTGQFLAPLESLEAARIILQSSSNNARAAPPAARRALAASYGVSDASALQTLLDAASTGVFVIAVAITTKKSDVGLAVACILANACADGNTSGVSPVSMAGSNSSSGGATELLSDAAGLKPGALGPGQLSGTVALVITALANATASAPAAFAAFVNISGATVTSELFSPTSELFAPPAAAVPPPALQPALAYLLFLLPLFLPVVFARKRVFEYARAIIKRLLECKGHVASSSGQSEEKPEPPLVIRVASTSGRTGEHMYNPP